MKRLIVNPQWFGSFPDWENELEICDEAGRTLGYFLPPELHRRLRYAWAKQQFSNEEGAEARRELEQAGGLRTADAIDFLRGLSTPENTTS
jgi:hypothetical protein